MNQPQVLSLELSSPWSGKSGAMGTGIVILRHSRPARDIDERPHRGVSKVGPPAGAVVLPRKVIVADPVLLIATVGAVVTVMTGNSPLQTLPLQDAAEPWKFAVTLGSANDAGYGYIGFAAEMLADHVALLYTAFNCGTTSRSMRCAMAASMAGMMSAFVTRTTWSLNDAFDWVVTNVASAGEVAFSHSR